MGGYESDRKYIKRILAFWKADLVYVPSQHICGTKKCFALCGDAV